MLEARLTAFERAQHRLARALAALPHRVQVLLSGRRPVRRDGLTLHPELQLIVTLRQVLGARPVSALTPEDARRRIRREAEIHAGIPVPVASVRDLAIETSAGTLAARHYAPELPAGAGPAPLLVYFHGGGYVLGDLVTHDPACRLLCRHGRVHVLSVDYRLAPEHPFPAAIEDGLECLAWAVRHASSLGADEGRVAVGGDSAGGNLAAVVSQLAVREGRPAPAAQVLIYPAVDRSSPHPSLHTFGDGFFLSRADIEWYHARYAGSPEAYRDDPRLSPLVAGDFSGLPPALVITAGFDPLRDEAEAYAAALEKAGVAVVHRRFECLLHGFINMTGVSRACREATVAIAEGLRALLEVPRVAR